MPTMQPLSLAELRQKAMRLPQTPGVYLMKNRQGTVIYVGKAKALKNRVSQYFGSHRNHGIKVIRMVENVADFDYILTDSEFEALVLECSLIKQYAPKYNILLKDDKGYSYIRVSNDGWPMISAVLQKKDDGATYIGPYTSHFTVNNSVDEALKIYRLPRCGKTFPQDIGKGRPCLNYFIKQCSAPCAGKISEAEYREAVDEALAFLRGGTANALQDLEKRMTQAAEALEFEKAARLRDRIQAIKRSADKQKVYSAAVEEQDVFAIVSEKEKSCLNVLRFGEGRLTESEFFLLDTPENLPECRTELVRSFYSMDRRIPPRIAVDGEMEDTALMEQWLSEKAGRRVHIVLPQRGAQMQLVELCRKNAAEKLMQSSGRISRQATALRELASLLGLPSIPEYIEAYDISHTAGSDNVAGMVVFRDGVPLKQAYKRFSVKTFLGQDDYGSMAEVLERRFRHYLEEKDSGEGFGKLPDLILLDGGQGQVHAVQPVLKQLGIDVPLFGMVKDNHHRTRAIAADGGEIALTSKRSAFTLVSEIQEEVHRFAIAYHRKKHQKSGFSSTLTEIEGIGPARAKALLQHFRTLAAVKNATVDDLCAVKGISRPAAQAVYDAFHPKEK
ncbi:MAG: excinuclease ABC subunit UvrC [Oscillospiraceae bacterium]|nr:excinuclease ABC subunit UvrC [Oscillospiraceae bacterium]